MKQFNNRLKVIELYVKLEVLNPQDKFLEDITVLLENYLDVEHLYLDISGGIVIGDISPNFARPIRVNIWKSFCLPPFYTKLSIGWCVNARSEELVEWMGDWEWAPEGSKKFMDLREAILLGDFIQEYIEFFIKTENPNHMFKEVLYGSDGELSIPHEYLSQNNIPCRRFYPYCKAGYRYLVETDPNNTEHGLKALIEATRPDGFILRILANNIIRANGVQFKVYHKDHMPRPTIPEWVKFPQALNQLGFDYLNHDGELI
uniref:Uncharacterized protein n=1 Tax=Acrobeloides nanus TaxID=290746 RepID=A0A914E930_9BILA